MHGVCWEGLCAAVHMLQKASSSVLQSSITARLKGSLMQVQLLTVLVRLEEVPASQVRDVYKLLLDDSYAIRHAAAELVTDMLEESGQRHLAQVSPHQVCMRCALRSC